MILDFIANINEENFIFFTIFFSTIISYLTCYFLRKISKLFKIEKLPSERGQHKQPIFHLGGISFITGTFIFFFLIFHLNKNLFDSNIFNNNLIIISIFSFILFITGLIDDLKDLSPFPRLLIMSSTSMIIWSQNIRFPELINIDLNISNFNVFLSNTFSQILTLLWIVGIVNAINWLDGLDGLAVGVSLLISIGLFFINLINNQIDYSIFALSIIGSCIGFLFHNKYPAKMFMGDNGSYFLGFSLSTLALLSAKDITNNNNNLIPIFLLFAVPVFDMARVILTRIFKKKSPFYPDRSHIHHFLLDKNFNHPMTVLIIYYLTNFSLSITLLLTSYKFGILWILISNIFLFIISKKIKKSKFT